MKEFITVAEFVQPIETIFIKHLLDKEHILYFFQNDTYFGYDPFPCLMLQSVFLKVHPDNFFNAKTIVERFNRNKHLRVIR